MGWGLDNIKNFNFLRYLRESDLLLFKYFIILSSVLLDRESFRFFVVEKEILFYYFWLSICRYWRYIYLKVKLLEGY